MADHDAGSDARINDLDHALHAVQMEIERYESLANADAALSLAIAPELQRFVEYRDEIEEKLEAARHRP